MNHLKYVLSKCSTPVWVKEFYSEREMCSELHKHICSDCLTGWNSYVGENKIERIQDSETVIQSTDWELMLGTSCGCEYEVDEQWMDDRVVFGNKVY